jgi:hypothetical protein
MKKFELCYSIDNDIVLFPSLLPAQEPSTPDFVEDNTVKFIIRYEFLPKAIMARFLVRMHDDISPEKRWRTGALLESRVWSARAFVRSNEDRRVIEIRVEGEQRREYLSIIVHTFRLIRNSLSGIKCVERIVIPDSSNVDVAFEHLLFLESHGHTHIIPEGSKREYSISELLGRIRVPQKEKREINDLLANITSDGETEESLALKLNKVIRIQPNFFGLGIDINELVRNYLKRPRR